MSDHVAEEVLLIDPDVKLMKRLEAQCVEFRIVKIALPLQIPGNFVGRFLIIIRCIRSAAHKSPFDPNIPVTVKLSWLL